MSTYFDTLRSIMGPDDHVLAEAVDKAEADERARTAAHTARREALADALSDPNEQMWHRLAKRWGLRR